MVLMRSKVSSRHLAQLMGPTIMAVGVTEAMNLQIWANVPVQVVYLNGIVLFVTGLAIVREHNRWSHSWQVLVTLAGWATLLLGASRMLVPEAPQPLESSLSYLGLAVMVAYGALLSYFGYRRVVVISAEVLQSTQYTFPSDLAGTRSLGPR